MPHHETHISFDSMAVRACAASLSLLAAALLSLAALGTPVALAKSTICSPGAGAGQCNKPQGLTVDTHAKRLYVADSANNRIDVFDLETGAFIKAFGFGVKTGAAEFQVCEVQCRAGLEGGAAGAIVNPRGIAVDDNPASASFHDVYVGELGSFAGSASASHHPRVEKFNPLAAPEGKGVEFIWMRGSGVDRTVSGDLCTASSGHTCGAAADSEADGAFGTPGASSEEGMLVGVGADSSLYVLDGLRPGGNESIPVKTRLQRFDEAGTQLGTQHIIHEGINQSPTGLGILPSGEFWASTGLAGRYDLGGDLLESIPLKSGAQITLDPTGDLFLSQSHGPEGSIFEFEDSGGSAIPRRRFGYGSFEGGFAGLAVASGEGVARVIVSERPEGSSPGGVFSVDPPPVGPGGGPQPIIFPEACKASPLGNSEATLRARVNPEGAPTKYHFELVEDHDFEEHGFTGATRVPPLPADDPTISSRPGQDFPLFELEEAGIETSALVPETGYHCRAIAENVEGTSTGQEGTFTSLPPLEIDATFASSVEEEAATLNAEVNPLGILSSAYFQYVDAATYEEDVEELGPEHGFDHAADAPAEAIDLGAGEEPELAATKVPGLSSGTEYRYRVVATDVLISPREVFGPTASFRTRSPNEGSLPDGRAYELVSPAQKGGADVAVPGRAGGLFNEEQVLRIEASSASASSPRITYTSWTSFGGGLGSQAASQYVSERTAQGWKTANVSPFGFLVNPLEPPFRGFSPDLETSAFVVDQPALTPEAQEGFRNLYLRDDQTGQIQALTVQEPQFTPDKNDIVLNQFCVAYGGASVDGSRAFFAADGAMAGAPEGKGFSLYEWSKQNGLSLVSVLPGEEGTPAKPAKESGFGASSGYCTIDQRILANAVSEDGRTVFWTYGGKFSLANRPLFVRLDGSETVEVDKKQTGAKGPSGEGSFWAATADGQRAFFSAPGKLTTDSEAAGQIYRFEARAPEGEQLTDLTPGPLVPQVQGVIGASANGSRLYFVGKGNLSGEEEGPSGEKAEAGANNLYLWSEGEGIRFIARLADSSDGSDAHDWDSSPQSLTARVSPGGNLAFLSFESKALSGYDSRIFPGTSCKIGFGNDYQTTASYLRCQEAYLYDASADTLVCASCNPTGQRPEGPAEVPKWSNPLAGPRYLSADGTKLFFESRDSLLGADRNKQRDVYEYEQSGSGTCTSQSPTYVSASGGCLYLISSDKSEDGSYLIDASEDGTDVYFSTRQPLVGWDDNPNYDVYDAREGGGFDEPLPTSICAGEACKPAAMPPPPGAATPGSATFQGSGNQANKPHGKKPGKHKKRGRHKKHHRKTGHRGRSSR
jgi:hypothetical protein